MSTKDMISTWIAQGIAQAVDTVKTLDEKKAFTNEKLVAGLKKLGFATREEVESLEARIEKLEGELRATGTSGASKTSKKSRSESATEQSGGSTPTETSASA